MPSAGRSPVTVAILFEGGLALVALGLYYFLGGSLGPWPGWTDDQPLAAAPYLRAVGQGVLATLPLLGMLFMLEHVAWRPVRELRDWSTRFLVPLFSHASVAQLAVISLAAGLGEELLFRGWVQWSLAELSTSPAGSWVAVLVAGVLFGLCHWLSATYAVLAALVGVYLGVLLIATENLVAPITTHALYDFLALLYILRGSRRERAPADASAI